MERRKKAASNPKVMRVVPLPDDRILTSQPYTMSENSIYVSQDLIPLHRFIAFRSVATAAVGLFGQGLADRRTPNRPWKGAVRNLGSQRNGQRRRANRRVSERMDAIYVRRQMSVPAVLR